MKRLLTIIIGTLLLSGTSHSGEIMSLPIHINEKLSATVPELPSLRYESKSLPDPRGESGAGFSNIVSEILPPITQITTSKVFREIEEAVALGRFL